MKLKTSDVPQADSLATVRRLLEVIRVSPSLAVKDLAQRSGFSERHVRYRAQAARILGFLAPNSFSLTPRAERLLATTIGAPEERREFRSAVSRCAAVREIEPSLLSLVEVDVGKLTKKISALSGLSHATAERRAVVLRSWHRTLRQ
jgi:hypothetical protein